MRLNIDQLRKIIAEEVSVLRESDRELFFDKLVPSADADRIFAALPPSFDDREYARTLGGRGRVPKGMDRIQITADPGKRVAKMLDAYQDYEAGRAPEKKRSRPEPWKKTFETIEGETCSVSLEPDGVIVLADSSGAGFNFSFQQARACAGALAAAASEQTVREREAGWAMVDGVYKKTR